MVYKLRGLKIGRGNDPYRRYRKTSKGIPMQVRILHCFRNSPIRVKVNDPINMGKLIIIIKTS